MSNAYPPVVLPDPVGAGDEHHAERAPDVRDDEREIELREAEVRQVEQDRVLRQHAERHFLPHIGDSAGCRRSDGSLPTRRHPRM